MNRRAILLTATLLATATQPAVRGQQQPAPQRATGTLTEGVTAVLVDVVVRDRRGQPVRDLTQADFQILEDGVPQSLGSFTTIQEQSSAAGSAPKPAGSPDPAAPALAAGEERPIVTALVFDRLTSESRRLAVQAAQGYLGSKPETDIYVGVFGIDIGLAPYASFTKNTRVLRQALDTMSKRASASFNSPEQRQVKADADQQAAIAGQQMAGATAAGGPGASGAMGTAAGTVLLAQMAGSMVRDFEAMERDQQGYSTINGLFAIIKAMRQLPGRKSLVLFSEGLSLPPAVQRLFLGVIDTANRANVSIYTMDAKGLRAESDQAKIRDQVNQAAGAGAGTLGTASGADPLTKSLEQNEAVLREDPQNGLGTLAQDTGGVFFGSTNNLRRGLDRIEDDLRNYYLLGYTPANTTFDGRFRTIEVKVNRPGVTVAARKGYFAVRDAGGLPINTFEAPALGALERKPVPNAFPIRAGALFFPERDRPGLVPVLVELKTAPLTFAATEDGKSYTSDFTVLVRFLDRTNKAVGKVSQHYEVKGPIAEIERAKTGDVIFFRRAELSPGVYTMETIVYDAPSGKASVRFSTVEVAAVDPAQLRMSSLVVVKRAENVPEKERDTANPLLVNGVALTPNLGDPVSKAAKEVPVYFALYPAAGGRGPDVLIQVVQNGTVTAQLPMPVQPPDKSGRIQQLGRLPIDQLAPGTYELRVVAKQGNEQVVRTTMLRIVD